MASRRGPAGTVRISINGTKQGSSWANVFWCNLTGGVSASQADLDAWTTAFQAAYKAQLQAVMTTDCTYGTARATLFVSSTAVLESTIAMTGAGTNAGTILNDNSACAVFSWLSTVYWRGGKPRTYLPGLTNAATTDAKTLTAGTITAYKAAAAAFRTAVNALTSGAITGTQLGFVSFQSGNADRPAPLFFAITGVTVHGRIGTQRRRLGKWQN